MSIQRPLGGRSDTLADATASEVLVLLAAGEVTALDYARACADRIDALEPRLHAWAWYDREHFEARAGAIDLRIAEHRRTGGECALPGRLAGVPVGVKDVFNTYDMPTAMGSEIMAGYTPGNDARVVSNVRLEHGIITGKTVTAEFAVHTPGPTVNPHDSSRTPGTSSSGSAAAVASGMVPIALATQTGASTIRPASYCGIYGFKPSYGVIPRTAMLKTTDTLDSVAFMTRCIDDLALIFEVTRVRGHNYPISETALNDPARQIVDARPWRVGLVRAPTDRYEAPAARTALNALADQLATSGCNVTEFTLTDDFREAHDTHERIYSRALAYYFKTEWKNAADKFSPRLAAMIEQGLGIGSDHYMEALDRQRKLAALFESAMSDRDALLCLSAADEAPKGLEAIDSPDNSLIWTLCGAPAISLPLLKGENGLPIGVQLVARRYNDYLLLRFARLIEQLA